MASKCVLVVLDGLGDRSFTCFGGRTPLEAARTPHLDGLAALGCSGLYHAGRLGQALPSENAHFAMFGYGAQEFPGRGALEALGAGIALRPGDVALLSRFVGLKEHEGGALFLRSYVPQADEVEADALAAAVSAFEHDGVRLRFHRYKGLLGVLVASGEVSPHVTDSNTMRDGRYVADIVPLHTHRDDQAAIRTAQALREYVRWTFRTLPGLELNRVRRETGRDVINGVVTQRAGRLRPVRSFQERYGMRGASITSGVMFRGLARYLGLTPIADRDTADPGADLARRLELARVALADHDFVFVHTKAPDEAAHRKDPRLKKRVIESLDRAFGLSAQPLLADPEVLFVVTSDHSTPSCGSLVHSGEPVPLLFHGSGIRRDEVRAFDEVSAGRGGWGSVRGPELMYLILNCLDRSRLEGVVDSPDLPDYWPGGYSPLSAR